MYLSATHEISEPYVFYRFYRQHYRHSDVSNGSLWHYLARMKSGNVRLETERSTVTVETGEIFYIPLGCRYQSFWSGNEIVWDSFAFPFFPNPDKRIYPLQKIAIDTKERELFEILGTYTIAESHRQKQINCEALSCLYQLLGYLLPHMTVEELSRDEIIVRRAKEIMPSMSFFSIPQLARQCMVSESTLYAAFRRVTGLSPSHVRQLQMIDKAKKLLIATDLTVQSVSENAGFSSEAYFYQVFRDVTGTTPREYRRTHTV